nr:MAG TPA: hypothetical protein [Caudoviricetes sp.]
MRASAFVRRRCSRAGNKRQAQMRWKGNCYEAEQ